MAANPLQGLGLDAEPLSVVPGEPQRPVLDRESPSRLAHPVGAEEPHGDGRRHPPILAEMGRHDG